MRKKSESGMIFVVESYLPCLMTIVFYAFHRSNPIAELTNERLYEKNNEGAPCGTSARQSLYIFYI